MKNLSTLSIEDEAAIEQLNATQENMVSTTIGWAEINTGSTNTEGLVELAPKLADAFSSLEAEVRLDATKPFQHVGADGEVEERSTGPIVRVQARAQAPVQIVLSGHYDTVFAPELGFNAITDLGDGKLNGPGLADMKGGLSLMLEALKTFERGPLKNNLGYQIVITPDEEIGNFASADALLSLIHI